MKIGAVARVRNALAFATHLFFQQRGYLYVHTPIITASDCEGAGEMFQITTLLNGIQEVKGIAQKVVSFPFFSFLFSFLLLIKLFFLLCGLKTGRKD
jgi:aspartyl/asparaginyl-tRNA synthetase